MARSNLVPYAFVLKKVKTMDFSETIVVDIKVGRCSQLNESMKLWVSKVYEALSAKGQGHSFTFFQITRIQYFKTSFPQ